MRRIEKRERPRESFSLCVAYESRQLFLSVYFVRNGELLTAFGTTRSQNATTVGSRHALTETMLVVSLAIVGLERSFHCCIYRYYCMLCRRCSRTYLFRSAKIITIPHPAKKSGKKCHYHRKSSHFRSSFCSEIDVIHSPAAKRAACSAMSSASSK